MPGFGASPSRENWADHLYPYIHQKPLFPYVRPGHNLTLAEHNLNRGANRSRQQFLDHVLPGGKEATYLTHPEVMADNWWERCCIEKPGFLTSMGRRLPDNLTKCSEYREEISEYAKFFNDYPQEEIRVPASPAASNCISIDVLFHHRMSEDPLDYLMTVYTRDHHLPRQAKLPQMMGWADIKRKKWIDQVLEKEVDYCTSYQKSYDRAVYDNRAAIVKKAVICPYIQIEEAKERERVQKREDDVMQQRLQRDQIMAKGDQPVTPCCGV